MTFDSNPELWIPTVCFSLIVSVYSGMIKLGDA